MSSKNLPPEHSAVKENEKEKNKAQPHAQTQVNAWVEDLTETPLSSEVHYRGIITTIRKDKAQHPSGKIVDREVVEHPGGVVAYPVLDDGRVVLVQQWRYPIGKTLLELPAGKLDWHHGKAEDPLKAIQRELLEETGYQAKHWEAITSIYTAPGFCDEKLWLFKASGLFNGHKAKQPSEQEWLNVVCLPPEALMDQIKTGQIQDAKTIALAALLCSQ
ncbi:MAG: NUDIX hydrolase [Cyanobacteria bacterium P01_H01_bin.74]